MCPWSTGRSRRCSTIPRSRWSISPCRRIDQPGVIDGSWPIVRRVRGILAQKPLAMTYGEAERLVEACEQAGVVLQVNQNMRYDHSVRALKTLLDRGAAGRAGAGDDRAAGHPALDALGATGAIAVDIHHEHPPPRHVSLLAGRSRASAGQHAARPADQVSHTTMASTSTSSSSPGGARASAWDDVWAGPAREGAGAEIGVRWRVEGTEGLALGTIGWPGWPERVPSTLDYSTIRDQGAWHRPRWPEAWFPDAFAGTMGGLLARPGNRARTRYLGPRQPEDNRPL